MPLGTYSSSGRSYQATIEGTPEASSVARVMLSSLTEGYRHQDKDLVADVIRTVASAILDAGRAYYEIAKGGDQDGGLSLYRFPPQRVACVLGWCVQCVPRADAPVFGRRFVCIASNKIWRIGLPAKLGGHRRHRAMLRSLERLELPVPRFFVDDMEAGRQTGRFDLLTFARLNDAAISRATQRWGWNRRDFDDERATEFFTFYRTVSFNWACAVLREHILRELNSLLSRLFIAARVVVSGLPTPAGTISVRGDLLAGRIQFGDAYQQTAV